MEGSGEEAAAVREAERVLKSEKPKTHLHIPQSKAMSGADVADASAAPAISGIRQDLKKQQETEVDPRERETITVLGDIRRTGSTTHKYEPGLKRMHQIDMELSKKPNWFQRNFGGKGEDYRGKLLAERNLIREELNKYIDVDPVLTFYSKPANIYRRANPDQNKAIKPKPKGPAKPQAT